VNEKGFLAVGIRLFGVYLAVHIISSTSMLLSTYAMKTSEFIENPLIYYSTSILVIITYIIMTVVFLFKAEEISNYFVKVDKNVQTKNDYDEEQVHKISHWLILIGVYFFFIFFAGLFENLLQFKTTEFNSMYFMFITGELVGLIMSLLLIFKSQVVECFIYTHSKNNG